MCKEKFKRRESMFGFLQLLFLRITSWENWISKFEFQSKLYIIILVYFSDRMHINLHKESLWKRKRYVKNVIYSEKNIYFVLQSWNRILYIIFEFIFYFFSRDVFIKCFRFYTSKYLPKKYIWHNYVLLYITLFNKKMFT